MLLGQKTMVEPTSDETSIPIRKILLCIGAIVAALIIWFIGSFINVYRKLPESYAAWTTGNLIVDYLNTHSNRWPQSWDDLESATNCLRYVPIEKLRTKVLVKWETKFDDLIKATRSNRATQFKLVTRPDGTKLHAVWGPDTDPNNKIKSYVLWVLTEPASSKGINTDKPAESRDSLHPPHQDLLH